MEKKTVVRKGLQLEKQRWFKGIADRPRTNKKARVERIAKLMSSVIDHADRLSALVACT